MKKIYVGCSLTHAPDEFKHGVDAIKNELRKDFEVMDFLGLVAGTAEDVYQWDIHNCVQKCDFFVAITDHPSLGLGYEMATAVEKLQKPTLALAQTQSKIGRIILGIEQPHYRFARYDTLEDIPALVKAFAAKFAAV